MCIRDRHNSVDSLLVLDRGGILLDVVWLETLIGKQENASVERYLSNNYVAVDRDTFLEEIISTIDYEVSLSLIHI